MSDRRAGERGRFRLATRRWVREDIMGKKKPSEAQRSKSIIICKHNEMGREVARLAQEVTINQCCPVLRFLCAAIGH